VAQRRFTQDEEEDEGDRKEQPEHPEQDRHQETKREPDHRDKERHDGGDMHELVLKVVAGKELPKSPLQASGSRPAAGG